MKATFRPYKDRSGTHRWRVVASNGKKMANAGEGYRRPGEMKASAIAAAVAILEALAPEQLATTEGRPRFIAYKHPMTDHAGKPMAPKPPFGAVP